MTYTRSSRFLRRALLADAATSAATGLLMMLGAGLLARLLGASAALVDYGGLSLLPFAGLVAYLASRETLPRSAVWAVIAYNVLWAKVDGVLLLISGWIEPTALGHAVLIAQALVLAMFAQLQYLGLRWSRTPTA